MAAVWMIDRERCKGLSLIHISHQLRVLKQSQLVNFRRDGKTVYYSLADSHVATSLNQGLEHVLE